MKITPNCSMHLPSAVSTLSPCNCIDIMTANLQPALLPVQSGQLHKQLKPLPQWQGKEKWSQITFLILAAT
jgi:hypothetical protein